MTIFLAFICAIVGMYSVLWYRMVGNYLLKDADFLSSFVKFQKKDAEFRSGSANVCCSAAVLQVGGLLLKKQEASCEERKLLVKYTGNVHT